ncbi:heat-inducible transcription repressor HrcA [bacterium]|nr:heat-inducible transcription repressor HrcA [bacterium]RQV94324.1 MAG: heat-inducible transcription repressor HrcA [bacterium]
MDVCTERHKHVLRFIVRSYIDTALPVGSKHLVQKYGMKYSSATVRNDMATLERIGYIKQPHTSAGRIPTDEGYKFYVESLMKKEKLSTQEKEKIYKRMDQIGGNVHLFLEEVSKILGQISQELSIVITPWISNGIFDRLELIRLNEAKILVVIHVQNRMVKTVILTVNSDLKQSELEKAASILNERLNGLTLNEIQQTIQDRVQDIRDSNRLLLQKVIDAASDIFDFSEPFEVYTGGTQHILFQPEFTDIHMLQSILSLIDNRKNLIHLFNRNRTRTDVRIGQENEDKRLHSFTVITTSYKRGNDVGTLGIVGPTRMRYSRILPLIETMGAMMSRYLS